MKNNVRSFEYPVILHAVNAVDTIAASIEDTDWPILHRTTDRILKEVTNMNRACHDSTPESYGTIEWE